MSETVMHVVGNVGTDVDHKEVAGGTHFCSFRLAATPRYYDRSRRAYVDGVTNWLTVHCWRYLAWHVFQSIHRGDPVVVVAPRALARSRSVGARQAALVPVRHGFFSWVSTTGACAAGRGCQLERMSA